MVSAMVESDELIYSRFLADHNEEDFRVLLERHRESLMLFIYSFVHNMDDAEDLMIDAYAEVAAGAVFSGRSTFKTWLFSIGKNQAMMLLRKKRRNLLNSNENTEEASELTELGILREERNRQLYDALTQLKDDYRQILILLYFEDMSHEEAGYIMRKNRKQIYNLAERARHALKERLERMGFDDAQYR